MIYISWIVFAMYCNVPVRVHVIRQVGRKRERVSLSAAPAPKLPREPSAQEEKKEEEEQEEDEQEEKDEHTMPLKSHVQEAKEALMIIDSKLGEGMASQTKTRVTEKRKPKGSGAPSLPVRAKV